MVKLRKAREAPQSFVSDLDFRSIFQCCFYREENCTRIDEDDHGKNVLFSHYSYDSEASTSDATSFLGDWSSLKAQLDSDSDIEEEIEFFTPPSSPRRFCSREHLASLPDIANHSLESASLGGNASSSDLGSICSSDVKTQPNLSGVWTCIHTWGLEEFLIACGAYSWQARLAAKMPWPEWEFSQIDSHITFVNRTSLGVLREHFLPGGSEYIAKDTRGKPLDSKAYWSGQTLVIDRSGEDGSFRETRYIDDEGKLIFKLEVFKPGMEGMAWGRQFVRKAT